MVRPALQAAAGAHSAAASRCEAALCQLEDAAPGASAAFLRECVARLGASKAPALEPLRQQARLAFGGASGVEQRGVAGGRAPAGERWDSESTATGAGNSAATASPLAAFLLGRWQQDAHLQLHEQQRMLV